jgi:hypothetical protein
MSKIDHIVAQLKSWETGYISPSAQMVMKDARLLIEEQQDLINDLTKQIELLRKKKEK